MVRTSISSVITAAIVVTVLQAPARSQVTNVRDDGAKIDVSWDGILTWGSWQIRESDRATADRNRFEENLGQAEELKALGLGSGEVVTDQGEKDSDVVGDAHNDNDSESNIGGCVYDFEILSGFHLANDINNRGQIVASSGLDGFLIDDGVLTPIEVPGAFGARPTNINENGEIIGFYAFGDPSSGAPTLGFHRDRYGSFTTIEFPGAHSTYLWGLNNRGDIVGYFVPAPPAPPFPAPFLLNQHGELTILDIPGSLAAVAFGINDRGTINGGFLDAGFTFQGYLLENGVFSTVNFPGAIGTDVARTNNKGELVGTHSIANPEAADSSYLRSKSGVLSDFAFPGAVVTLLSSINERGDLSGYFFSGPMSPPQAFIARCSDDD